MDELTLLESLLKAEDEIEVDEILHRAGYLTEDPNIWQTFDNGNEMSFNTIANQHSDPTGALVEKLVNAIDAVLMAQCFKNGISPKSPEAPQSMTAAVQRFFNIKDGRLENIAQNDDDNDEIHLGELADQIHLIATGSKTDPSYLIIDRGEGQTPAMFSDTFLSLRRSNKRSIPFVQGKFNSGGTGILQFCGDRNYQLIVSKRHPSAPAAEDDDTRDKWGFTLVRRLRPGGASGRDISMYVYLAPQGKIPCISKTGIKVLPSSSSKNSPGTPYSLELAFGTCVKLYNYRWKARSLATTEARFELQKFLHSPTLPFRITETRDYRANYYSTTLSGVWIDINLDKGRNEDKRKVEEGFPGPGEISLPKIGALPYQIALFRDKFDARRLPHGIFFTLNGQVHGALPPNYIKTNLKFDFLSSYLLISVECSSMDAQVREDFFMASRDRIRQNEIYDEIVRQLKEELLSHPGLRLHDALRKKRQLEKTLSDDNENISFFQDLLKSDPTLSALLGNGQRLVTSTGPAKKDDFKGRKFPTFFRLSKEPTGGLVKLCPLNKSVRIELETDAENDYFTRADSPGKVTLTPPNLLITQHLWNGKWNTRFQMPWDANVNDIAEITVTISDVESDTRNSPFISKFLLKGIPETESTDHPSGPPRTRGKRVDSNGKQNGPAVAPPDIREVRRELWNDPGFTFNEHTAIKITHGENENSGYIFWINVDNEFLLTELTRTKEADKPLIKFWFKYGLTLCAMGILQDEKSRRNTRRASNNEGIDIEENGEDLELIGRYCNGISRVIVPIIRRLYRGPELSTGISA